MSDFSLTSLIQVIWQAVTGGVGGVNYVTVFSQIAVVIWGFMGFVMFASEALDLAAGRGFKLDKKLVVYAFLGLLIFVWPNAANNSYNAAANMAEAFMGDSDAILDTLMGSYLDMQDVDETTVEETGLWDRVSAILVMLPQKIGQVFFTGIGVLITLACYILILIMIAGMFATFAMTLALGPVFVALGLSEHFRQYAWRWFGCYLTYFLAIPLYGAALQIVVAIFGAGVVDLSQMQGGVGMDHMAVSVFGPLVSLGVVFAVSKVVSGLTGGAMGGTGSLAMSLGMGAAGIAGRAMGGASAAGGAAMSGASVATAGASNSVKAATAEK